MAELSERITRLRPSVVREILAAAQSPEVISFAGGLPAPETLPVAAELPPGALWAQYGRSEGEPALRAAAAAYFCAIGLPSPAERVLILNGSQQGLDLAAKLFVDRGTPLVTESPTYVAALQVFELFGAALCGAPLVRGQLDLAAFEHALVSSRARLVYLNPSFQNPTGACYDAATRAAIAALLDRHDVALIEDDPYRELWYGAPPPAPIASRLRRAAWIYQTSLSKVFAPGIRVGLLTCSADLFSHLVPLKQAADLHSNRVGQVLALARLTDAAFDERLEAVRAVYREKRDAFARALERHLSALCDWELPEGGLFFWPRLHAPRALLPLLPRAIERGVAFVPGEACFFQAEAPLGHFRLNFSHAGVEQMDAGLARLAALLRDA